MKTLIPADETAMRALIQEAESSFPARHPRFPGEVGWVYLLHLDKTIGPDGSRMNRLRNGTETEIRNKRCAVSTLKKG